MHIADEITSVELRSARRLAFLRPPAGLCVPWEPLQALLKSLTTKLIILCCYKGQEYLILIEGNVISLARELPFAFPEDWSSFFFSQRYSRHNIGLDDRILRGRRSPPRTWPKSESCESMSAFAIAQHGSSKSILLNVSKEHFSVSKVCYRPAVWSVFESGNSLG